uniref:F-box domain-containing protein n=1 Tax=Mycena chlorophos TaxID=658473 RepID=A0ABQ0LPJ6_MYCCL|nr:predicted protein [Mycena chlorophos]
MQSALPPELEHHIFELAARSWAICIPRLVLVAWRVKEWVEPLLYRTLLFCPRSYTDIPSCSTQTFQQLLDAKSSDYLALNVHNLLLWDINMNDVPPILECLTGLRNIFLFPDNYRGESFTIHCKRNGQLRHLYCTSSNLEPTFDDAIFSRLTHLELFTGIPDNPNAVHTLASLPSLSHLALDKVLVPDRLQALLHVPLSETRLRTVVILANVEDGTALDHILKTDMRLVVLGPFKYIQDWVHGVTLGVDFWTRADDWIAKRLSGEVDRNAYHISRSSSPVD